MCRVLFVCLLGRGCRVSKFVQVCTLDSKTHWSEGRSCRNFSHSSLCGLTGVEEKQILWVKGSFSILNWKSFSLDLVYICFLPYHKQLEGHLRAFTYLPSSFISSFISAAFWAPEWGLVAPVLQVSKTRLSSCRQFMLPGKESWTGPSSVALFTQWNLFFSLTFENSLILPVVTAVSLYLFLRITAGRILPTHLALSLA